MIRFSATLAIVATGALIGGGVTNKLTLIYLAIVTSAVALVTLAIGVVLKREEIFGQVRAPAGLAGSTELPASGQVASVDGGADHGTNDPVRRNGPVAPPATPLPALAATTLSPAPGTDSVDEPSSGLSPLRTLANGQAAWDAVALSPDSEQPEGRGRAAYGQPVSGQSAFGQNPARNPWPTSSTGSGWAVAEPSAPPAGDPAGPPWSESGLDPRSDPDGDTRLPPSPPARTADGDRWPSFSPAEPGSRPESSPPPSAATAHRIPDAPIGSTWFNQQDGPGQPAGRREPSATEIPDHAAPGSKVEAGKVEAGKVEAGPVEAGKVEAGKVEATPVEAAPVEAGKVEATPVEAAPVEAGKVEAAPVEAVPVEAAPRSGTAAAGGWSSPDWSWSSLAPAATDDAATTAPGSSPASGGEDDDWPSRYSWLEDDTDTETDNPDADRSSETTRDSGLISDLGQDDAVPRVALADTDGDEPKSPKAARAAEIAQAAQAAEPAEPGAQPGSDVEAGAHDPADGKEQDGVNRAAHPAHPAAGDAGPAAAAETIPGIRLVSVVSGVPRYHEPGCILIRFMPKNDVRHMPVPEARKLGTPCVACQPRD